MNTEIDWMQCKLVESVEGRCGGQPTIMGTRIFPEPILNMFESGDSVEQIHDSFPTLSIEQIEGLIRFALQYSLGEAA